MEKNYPPISGKERHRTNNYHSKGARRRKIVAFVWVTFFAVPLIASLVVSFVSFLTRE